ncbi:MAG: DUF3078 domain-containing protein [Bacteroidetes bacterium]|nr:DUF3078 domain-containing protein [Bacteroidota bacterium]
MKRFLFLSILFLNFTISQVFSIQPIEPSTDTIKVKPIEKYWKFTGNTSLNFNQVSFSNWASGGSDALSGTAGLTLNANYKRKSLAFENTGIFFYGLIDSQDKGLMKMEDRLELNSKLDYKAVDSWHYSLLSSLKSQFAPGFSYPDKTHPVSRFFAPAYLTLSLGMDYTPVKYFSLFLSPASGKFTFVLDQNLADAGAFGVRPAVKDAQGNILYHGEPVKPELGITLNTKIKYEIFKNVILDSKLNLYDNYLDEDVSNRWNVDVDWENNINFVINSVISSTFNSRMLYDNNIMIPLYDMINGVRTKVGQGPRLQIKEAFGIGMVMKLGDRKKKN